MGPALGVVGAILLIGFFFGILRFRKLLVIAQPSEVVVFSGPNRRPDQKVGFKHVRGGRGIRIPLLEKIDRIDLTNIAVDVGVRGAYTRDGVPINVQGVANVKISGDVYLEAAVERLLGKSRGELVQLARETLEGNLRGVLAKLTPEQVNEDKEAFALELISEADEDLRRLGLSLDTLKIQTVSDDVGYLDAIGRIKGAELIRRARIAEADRKSESEVQEAENLQKTRLAQLQAEIQIAEAEANKRIVDAKTQRGAEVARERATIEAQIARAEAEMMVQQARIEQVKLQLEADLLAPAKAYKERKEAEAKAQVAPIRESGLATAQGLRELATIWRKAGDQAREIFLLEKFRTLVGIMVGTVKNVRVDQLTVIGDGASTAGQAASLIEQLRSGADVDVPELLKRLSIGARAVKRIPPASEKKK